MLTIKREQLVGTNSLSRYHRTENPTGRSYAETPGQQNSQKRKQHVMLQHGWQLRRWRWEVMPAGETAGKSGKTQHWKLDREPSKDSKPGFLFSLCNIMRMNQTLLQSSCFHWGNSLLHTSFCVSLCFKKNPLFKWKKCKNDCLRGVLSLLPSTWLTSDWSLPVQDNDDLRILGQTQIIPQILLLSPEGVHQIRRHGTCSGRQFDNNRRGYFTSPI